MTRAAGFALAMLMVCAVPAYAISDPAEMLANPAQEARAERIGQHLRCLVCQNESIEDSGADLAKDLRGIVRQRVAAGDTDSQITAWMVARYGEFVRLSPAFNVMTAVLWLSPVLAVLLGLGFAWGGRRNPVIATEPLTDAERNRLADL